MLGLRGSEVGATKKPDNPDIPCKLHHTCEQHGGNGVQERIKCGCEACSISAMHAGTHDASHFLIWRLLRWEGGIRWIISK